MKEFNKIKACVCCGSTKLQQYLNLGKQPLPNIYPQTYDINVKKFPLKVMLCKECYHSQLNISVNPKLLFDEYIYVSGTSNTLRDYFKRFAKEKVGSKSVLDIASNDGSLLSAIKDCDQFLTPYSHLLGIDPAKNLAILANTNGIPTICEYFSSDLARKINKKFDIIIAQNVFAHVQDPFDFLMGCELLMHKESKLYIQTSQANMVANREFDTCYFEHISFFNINSMLTLLNQTENLFLNNVELVPIHGGSYLFTISKNDDITPNRSHMIKNEIQNHIYSLSTYKSIQTSFDSLMSTLSHEIQSQTNKVIGYGAAAKGNTILNYTHIKLEYIVDENPLKHFCYTPGTKIPIKPLYDIKKEPSDLTIVILAWNFYDEIKDKIAKLRPTNNDTLITYFPAFRKEITNK